MGRTLQRYKKLFDTVKTGKPRAFYFLYGPEEYLKKEFIGELIKTTLPDKNRAFNLDVFHGDEFDRDVFNDRVSSFPLFAETRMVIIKKFEALSTPHKDFVIEAAGSLTKSVVLVVETINDKLDTARLKSIKKVADDSGLSFKFDHLSEPETVERIKTRIQRAGLAIKPDALDLLVESVGTRLIDLVGELDKIILSSESDVVTKEGVASVVGKYRTENLFAFLDCMGAKDVAVVIKRMNNVIDSGEEPVFVLAMMMRRVLQLLQVKLLLHEEGPKMRSPRALATRLSGLISPFQATRLIEQSHHFDTDTLVDYLENLRWADVKLKSTSIPARSLLETSLLASSLRKTLATRAI